MPSARLRYLSPLRYPGGKGRLGHFVGDLIAAQPETLSTYVEPFAGGAGVGLRLLFDEYVDEIVLNDLNPGIAAFWRTLFADPDGLLERVEGCEPTIDEWSHQRLVYESKAPSDADLGFATFFLNRTNRSGILDARPIGGLEQTGKWKIDARYDRERLADRIRLLSGYASRVTVLEEDGVDLIARYLRDSAVFIYADPPYLTQGDALYLDTFDWEDHERLARLLRDGGSWLLTYDADARITRELYTEMRCAAFTTSHTAGLQHIGREYAVFSPSLDIPSLRGLGSRTARFL